MKRLPKAIVKYWITPAGIAWTTAAEILKTPEAQRQLKACAAITVALALSACATPGIPPPPQIVNVPVPVSCLPSTMPVRPLVHTDPQLSALDDFKFTLAIFSDRRVLLDYSAELEAVLLACK